jgi:hypothetical protein
MTCFPATTDIIDKDDVHGSTLKFDRTTRKELVQLFVRYATIVRRLGIIIILTIPTDGNPYVTVGTLDTNALMSTHRTTLSIVM